jgi:hypothetical protein
MAALNISEIAVAFDKFVGKHRKQLMWQILQDSVTTKKMRVEAGIQEDQYYTGTNVFTDQVWQPYILDGKAKKGGMTMIPNKTLQRRHMVHLDFKPDKIRGTLEGRLAPEGKDPTMLDIVKYMVEGVQRQINDDRENLVVYKGKYVAPVADVVSPAGDAVDGLNEVIEAGLEQTDVKKKINPLQHLDLSDEDTLYAQVKEAVKQVPAKFRTQPLKWNWSPDAGLAYRENRQSIIGQYVNTSDKDANRVPNTNWTFEELPSMTDSNRMFLCRDENMHKIIDSVNEAATIEVLRFSVDAITIYATWCEAYGFDFNPWVWANVLSNNFSGGGDENESFVD